MAAKLTRNHWETVWFFAFAALSIAARSSVVTRTRSITFLVLPLGSGGRPGFLGFGCGIAKLLNEVGVKNVCHCPLLLI
jgi:hypothetical protein